MLDGALVPHAEAIIRFFLQNTASDYSAGQVGGHPEFWGQRPKVLSRNQPGSPPPRTALHQAPKLIAAL